MPWRPKSTRLAAFVSARRQFRAIVGKRARIASISLFRKRIFKNNFNVLWSSARDEDDMVVGRSAAYGTIALRHCISAASNRQDDIALHLEPHRVIPVSR